MSVTVDVQQSDDEQAEIDHARWGTLARETLESEGVENGHVDVFFVSRDEMAELNLQHMGKNGPTDVLSFPLEDDDDPFSTIDGEANHLGDIVISLAVATEQAPDHAGSLDAELSLLTIHGVLHLLGHDHVDPDETATMWAREALHLGRSGFAHPGRHE